MPPIIALWATPRSASTAFERMMIERGDHTVFDEPFSATYYFSHQRTSDRFEETLPDSSAGEVSARIRDEANRRPVFLKDMATHVLPYLEDDDLRPMTHSFLIRDPRRAVPSLVRRWPDAGIEEAGYRAQRRLCRRIADLTGEVPPVIDAEALRSDPHGIVRAWCGAVGIPFVEAALRWEAGMQPQWILWRDWYAEVANSTGFSPPSSGDRPSVDDPHIEAVVGDALVCYEELASRALAPV